jgi:hypothetical protein
LDIESMNRAKVKIAALALALALATLAGPAAATETIVFLRHGEKPAAGLGQLDCQGLNRALALPAMIARAFGKPDVIYAPNPAIAKTDDGRAYDYVRPLMTIEPAAIAFGLPVHAHIGFANVAALDGEVAAPADHDALVVVAWEHRLIDVAVRQLLADHGGDATQVPDWGDKDFDSIDVVRIDWSGAKETATFTRSREGLDGQPQACPK